MQVYYSVVRWNVYFRFNCIWRTFIHPLIHTFWRMNKFTHLKSETPCWRVIGREWWIEKGRMKGLTPFWRAIQTDINDEMVNNHWQVTFFFIKGAHMAYQRDQTSLWSPLRCRNQRLIKNTFFKKKG